ncbi:MAG: Uncharacterized protein XD69_1412 [Clostridia bacterium 62_21]|nr:MAG: Uncharacterized protein XD69_1412 [Clostridia bacterium 62_21]
MAEIREVIVDVVKRLGEAPEVAYRLAKQRGDVSDALHRALDRMRDIEARVAGEVAAERNGDGKPVYPNEATRNAETARRLAADRDYQAARNEVDRLRAGLREVDAEIERVSRRHRSDANLAYLVGALFQAGRPELAEAALAAYRQAKPGPQPQEAPPPPEPTTGDPGGEPALPHDGPQVGMITCRLKVLEVRDTDRGGVRAWCKTGFNGHTAVFARGQAAEALRGAAGKVIEVEGKKLDKGVYAVKVRAVS